MTRRREVKYSKALRVARKSRKHARAKEKQQKKEQPNNAAVPVVVYDNSQLRPFIPLAVETAKLIKERQTKLLVVTTDASGGGRSSGIAAVRRLIDPSMPHDSVLVSLDTVDYDDAPCADYDAQLMAKDKAVAWLKDQKKKDDVLPRVILLTDCSSVVQRADFPIEELEKLSPNVIRTLVKSNHTKRDGFFDHNAADLLAVMVRGCRSKRGQHGWVHNVPPKGGTDLEWLSKSLNWKLKKGGSAGRKERCRSRIELELGIDVRKKR